MNTRVVIVVAALLALFFAVGIVLSSSSSSGPDWKCFNGSPLSINAAGDVQCWSDNAKDCVWGWGDQCQAKLASALASGADKLIQPLVCGAAHNAIYGKTGYDDPKHWCAIYKSQQ